MIILCNKVGQEGNIEDFLDLRAKRGIEKPQRTQRTENFLELRAKSKNGYRLTPICTELCRGAQRRFLDFKSKSGKDRNHRGHRGKQRDTEEDF